MLLLVFLFVSASYYLLSFVASVSSCCVACLYVVLCDLYVLFSFCWCLCLCILPFVAFYCECLLFAGYIFVFLFYVGVVYCGFVWCFCVCICVFFVFVVSVFYLLCYMFVYVAYVCVLHVLLSFVGVFVYLTDSILLL